MAGDDNSNSGPAPATVRPNRGAGLPPGLSRADIDAVLKKPTGLVRQEQSNVVSLTKEAEGVKEEKRVEETEKEKEVEESKENKEDENKEEKKEEEKKGNEEKSLVVVPAPEPTPQPTMPAIVTYPEHLLPSPPAPPAPLITPSSLLSTAYGLAGVTLALYGTNQFVVQPLLNRLNDARHQLFSLTQTNLTKMHEKLDQLKPEIPIDVSTEDSSGVEPGPDAMHSSRAIQTDLIPPTPLPSDPEASLDALNLSINGLVDVASQPSADRDLSSALDDLSSYLEGLRYGGPPALGGGAEEDDIQKVKTEIRGVKGVLLNSRNFPAVAGR